MRFITDLLKNLGILIVIGLALLILFPAQISQVFQLYGALFGPGLIIVMLVVFALPRRRRSRRRY